jgi:uncharacterized membrane protein YccC
VTSAGADVTTGSNRVRRAIMLAPGRADWWRGVKLAVAMMVPVVVGIVVDRPADGLFVAIGAFVVASTDIGGPYRPRATVMAGTAAGVAVAYFLGTVSGDQVWLAGISLALVLFGSALVGILGPRIAVASTMVAIAFLIGTTLPSSLVADTHSTVAILVGGCFALALSLAGWPFDPWRPVVSTVAGSVDASGRYVGSLLNDGAADGRGTAEREAARSALAQARQAVEEARPRRGQHGGTDLCRRLETVVTATGRAFNAAVTARQALHRAAGRPEYGALSPAIAAVIRNDEAAMADAAAALRRRGAVQGSHDLIKSMGALSGLVHAARDGASPDPGRLAAFSVVGQVLPELARLNRATIDLIGAIDDPQAPSRALIPAEPVDPWWRQVRGQLDPRMPGFRHGVRLAVAGIVGLLVAHVFDRSHGAWLVSSAVLVLKPNFGGTLTTALQRGTATIAGALVAGGLVAATTNRAALTLLATGAIVVAMSIMARSYAWGILVITPLSILLTSLFGPAGWSVVATRIADVAIGVAIAVVVGFVVLPGWVEARIGPAVDGALRAERDYLHALSAPLRGERRDEPAVHGARSRLESQVAAVAVVVNQLRDEPVRHRPDLSAALQLVDDLRAVLDASVSLDEHVRMAVEPLPEAAAVVFQLERSLGRSVREGTIDSAALDTARHFLDELVDRLVRARARQLTTDRHNPAMDPALELAGPLPPTLGDIAAAFERLFLNASDLTRSTGVL